MLPHHAYNPSLIRHGKRLLMSCRAHDRKDWRTSLYLAELDANLKVTQCKPILPPESLANNSHEDARLRLDRDSLCISWSVSQWPAETFRGIIAHGRLVEGEREWRIVNHHLPAYGKNDFSAIEKNWLWFSVASKTYVLYETKGEQQTILEMDNHRVEEVYHSKAFAWKWGPIHGGALVSAKGRLYHFFNSRTGHARNTHRYHIGCAELSGEPPFDTLRISQRPILSGEEGYCLDGYRFYKPSVAFCCGAIYENNQFLVSYGDNDQACRIVTLQESDLNL